MYVHTYLAQNEHSIGTNFSINSPVRLTLGAKPPTANFVASFGLVDPSSLVCTFLRLMIGGI
jgi:hypothetical protein